MATPVTFGDVLSAYLLKRRMTQIKFAELCGLSPGSPNNIITGRRTPPPEKLGIMADALSLEGKERDTFIWLGYLAHSPKEVWSRVAMLEAELAALRERTIRQYDRILSLVAENARLRGEPVNSVEEVNSVGGNPPAGGRQGPGGGRISQASPPGGAGAPDHDTGVHTNSEGSAQPLPDALSETLGGDS